MIVSMVMRLSRTSWSCKHVNVGWERDKHRKHYLVLFARDAVAAKWRDKLPIVGRSRFLDTRSWSWQVRYSAYLRLRRWGTPDVPYESKTIAAAVWRLHLLRMFACLLPVRVPSRNRVTLWRLVREVQWRTRTAKFRVCWSQRMNTYSEAWTF